MDLLRLDAQLHAAFRRGDARSLEVVYSAYKERVERHVRRSVRRIACVALQQPCVVADIVQDVFVRAFSERSRDAYDSARDYGAYLSAIARNCVFDMLREQRRHARLSRLAAEMPLEAAESSDEPNFDPRVQTIMNAYLAQLPERSFAVYQQRYVLGASQGQASAALGVTRAALRTQEGHLARGLHHVLREHGLLDDGLPL